MKRIRFRVIWNRKAMQWQMVNKLGQQIDLGAEQYLKRAIVSLARAWCRGNLREDGLLSQLLIYNKDGKIQRGNGGEATYGKDPRRSKG